MQTESDMRISSLRSTTVRAIAPAVLSCLSFAPSAAAQVNGVFQGPSASSWIPTSPFAASALVTQSGGVVITEIMKDPSFVTDTNGEWFEVYNRLPWRVNIEGWTISDDGGSVHVIANGGNGLLIPSQRYFLFGNNGDTATNGQIAVDYEYSSFSLGNASDQIQLARPNGVIVDRVAYDDGVLFPDSAGTSLALNNGTRNALQNDDGVNWCDSTSLVSLSNPDLGTPGSDNDACP